MTSLRQLAAAAAGIVIGLAAPGRATAEEAATGAAMTPAEADVRGLQVFFEELRAAVERARGYAATVRALGALEHGRERERRAAEHGRLLADGQAALDTARRQAVTALEAFVREHPDDPDLTPDALLRLAELEYETASARFIEAAERVAALRERWDAGEEVEIPSAPTQDDSRCIDLTRRIVRGFPSYPHLDGALYLLGFCLSEAGQDEEARSAWLHLVCADRFQYTGAPPAAATPAARSAPGPFVDPYASCTPVVEGSPFATETWLRIGESHFDSDYSATGLDLAIAAYRHAAADRTSRLRDLAMYKMAWSYYRLDRYPEAIEQFVAVATLADEPGAGHGTEVRPEAITYLGICFTEDDWDGDTLPDATRGIDRLQDPALLPQDRSLTREVYLATADTYFDLARYADAIEVYDLTVRRWPLALEAPRAIERVVLAYERNRQFDEAAAARARLRDYEAGSAWQRANADDHPDAAAAASTLARNAAHDNAIWHHQVAQRLQQAGMEDSRDDLLRRAGEEYALAARAYRAFLERYPHDPDAYELTFNMAEAFFHSAQYPEAAEAYARVRDSRLDDRLRDDAARRAAWLAERLRETGPPDDPAPSPADGSGAGGHDDGP